jgi:hypothetical protein
LTEMPRFERDAEGTGVIFFLEDEVCVSLKGNSETRATAQLWRADDPATMTAPIVGNILGETFRSRLVALAKEKFGAEFDEPYLARLRGGLGQIATAFNRGTDEETGRAVREFLSVRGPSRPILLLRYAQEAEYFHDPDEETYATVPQDLRKETWPLRSRGFKRWLRYTFYYKEKQRLGGVHEPAPLRESVISDVVKQLEAKAQFEGVRRAVHLRVAEMDGKIYLDLCNRKWQVVEVSSEGWQVRDASDVPVRFIRSKGMAALPLPDEDGFGSVEPLRALLNLQGEDGERSFRLILAWLMQALRARGPYPDLVLLGERGSAKSTAARILRSLVDPSTVPLRTMPRNPHDLYIDAVSSWMICLDNISSLPKWLSDTLCMMATGGGFSTRTLFTDREQELFNAMRPIALNGITDVVTADDLVQRSLIVRLPTLAKGAYKTEREIQRELEVFRPQILAALLDAAAEGLRRIDSVKVKALPRMGDFASWAVATEVTLGGEEGSFMEALDLSDEEGAQQALEASPLAEPLYQLAQANPDGWEGTASEMLAKLREYADEDLQHTREWPKAANVLSGALKRLAPLFREAGQVQIQQLSRADGQGSKRWSVKPLKAEAT